MRFNVLDRFLCDFPRLEVLLISLGHLLGRRNTAIRARHTWRHHSRWTLLSSIASFFKSATFCLWNRSRSACKVIEAYLRSCSLA